MIIIITVRGPGKKMIVTQLNHIINNNVAHRRHDTAHRSYICVYAHLYHDQLSYFSVVDPRVISLISLSSILIQRLVCYRCHHSFAISRNWSTKFFITRVMTVMIGSIIMEAINNPNYISRFIYINCLSFYKDNDGSNFTVDILEESLPPKHDFLFW